MFKTKVIIRVCLFMQECKREGRATSINATRRVKKNELEEEKTTKYESVSKREL